MDKEKDFNDMFELLSVNKSMLKDNRNGNGEYSLCSNEYKNSKSLYLVKRLAKSYDVEVED